MDADPTWHVLVHLSQVVSAQVTGQGGGWLLTGHLSLVVGIGWRVYAVFEALTNLVVLADLGDVAV